MSDKLDTHDDKYETGDLCPQSGRWICKIHPSVEEFVKEGDVFPRCIHVSGHDTTWYQIASKNDPK